MPVIGLRELSRKTGATVEQLEATGEPIIITKQGHPIAALVAVDRDRLQDLVLATAPEFVRSTKEADDALAAGITRPMSEVLADMADREAASGAADATSDPARGTDGGIPPLADQLVAEYAELVTRFSGEASERPLVPADASEIRALQEASINLFREFISSTLARVSERARAVVVGAERADGEEGGGPPLTETFDAVVERIPADSADAVGQTDLGAAWETASSAGGEESEILHFHLVNKPQSEPRARQGSAWDYIDVWTREEDGLTPDEANIDASRLLGMQRARVTERTTSVELSIEDVVSSMFSDAYSMLDDSDSASESCDDQLSLMTRTDA